MNIALLKNRSQPPGGWSYWCPVGEMDFPGGFAFDVQVDKIRKYRAANPGLNLPSDLGSVRHELLRFTFARLRKRLGPEVAMQWFAITDADDSEIDELIKKKPSNSPSEAPAVAPAKPAGIVETVQQVSTGARILADWLGEGAVPVSPKVAQARADTCKGCEFNQAGNWLQRFAGAVGGFLKEQMELKARMELKVKGETKLKTCAVCSCHLPLLVWTPIETLAERTDAATLGKYPAHCWKAQEIHRLNYQ